MLLGIIVYNNDQNLKKNHLFTIGKPTKVWYINFRYEYDYVFYIDNKEYKDRSDYSDLRPKEVIGKKFCVIYEVGNPSNSKILFDIPIMDSTTSIP